MRIYTTPSGATGVQVVTKRQGERSFVHVGSAPGLTRASYGDLVSFWGFFVGMVGVGWGRWGTSGPVGSGV